MKHSTQILWSDDKQVIDNIVTYSRNRAEAKKHALDIYCDRCPNRMTKVETGKTTNLSLKERKEKCSK
jgi:hypothetical protein